tara:strand:- start:11654 stop:12874 length:1221 start_codon:yes stop_codon:yes gene_type:complete
MNTNQSRISWPILILFGILFSIAPFSIDMYLPAFPDIEKSLGLDSGSVGMSLSSYFVGMLVGILIYGPVSDRYGRRTPLLIGMAAYSVASLVLAQSESLTWLVSWRFLQAISGCVGSVLVQAIIRDLWAPEQAAHILSLLMMAMGVAPVVSPMIGAWVLETFGWQQIFYCLFALGIASFVGTLLLFHESLPPSRRTQELKFLQVMRVYGLLFRNRIFMGYLSGQAFAAGAMFAYIAGSPYVLMDMYGVDAGDFGKYFTLNAVGLILFSQLNRMLLLRFKPEFILRVFLYLPFVGGSMLMVNQVLGLDEFSLVLLGFFLVVASLGGINANASALAMAGQMDNSGQASAMIGACTFGTGMLGSFMVSYLHDGSSFPVAICIVTFSLTALLLNHLLVSRLSSDPDSGLS